MIPALALGGTLTWLLVESQETNGDRYMAAQRDVARVSLAEAALQADVLEVRAGMIRNYDVLDADVAVLREEAVQLRDQAHVRTTDTVYLDQLMTAVDREEAALETFKTDDAVLNNSRAYFDTLDMTIIQADLPPAISAAVASLGNTVLQLTGLPSEGRREQVRVRIAELSAFTKSSEPDPAVAAELRLLVAHSFVLERMIPRVYADLRTFFAISTDDARQAIRRGQDARRRAEERRASHFRFALYAVSILLLLILLRVYLNWRAGAQALRVRAELESLLSAVSTRLVITSLENETAALAEALARLGDGFRADRAYVLTEDSVRPIVRWARPGVTWRPAWPDAVRSPALGAKAIDDLLDYSSPDARADDALRTTLRAHGVAGWCGVVLRKGGRPDGILGFDRVAAEAAWPRGGPGLIRIAGEVISGALNRKRASLERLDLESRLGRARRLEAVGAFASGIAHNVNNVVGAVMGHVEMASEMTMSGTSMSYHLREIGRAGERAQQLVASILEFGTRALPKFERLDVDRLIEDVASMLRVTIPPMIELVVDVQAPGRVIHGDATHLQQVIVNLVRNAEQAIEGKGRVVVRVDTEEIAAVQVLSHDVVLMGRYVRFAISDTGSGMNPQTLGRIFEPFYTSKPAGTGLGLATVREAVHDHGGAIDVVSTLGRGSVFTVWFPLANRAATAPPRSRGDGEAVLLVSSDEEQLRQDEETVAALGYEPTGAKDIEAALRLAGSRSGDFIAMLLGTSDVRNALDMVRRVHEGMPLLPIVLVADASSDAAISELVSLGVIAVLTRPLRSTLLADAIGHCCASSRNGQNAVE